MPVIFVRKVRQSGRSSPEITIPKPMLDAAHLSIGEKVMITMKDDAILIKKFKEPEKGASSDKR